MTNNNNPITSFFAVLKILIFLILMILVVPITVVYKLATSKQPFKISCYFYGLVLKVLGMRVCVVGVRSTAEPVFFVSNHISYLDVIALGSVLPAAFVAKSEVADWPLFGFVAKVLRTVFIERRAVRAASQQKQLQNHLAQRLSLILFPEGTSSEGLSVLPFKSSLFSIVEEAVTDITVTVQPVSIACTELDGLPITRAFRPYYAWFGDMTLLPHLWNVFKMGHFTVEITFHAPAPVELYANRKALAAYCQEQVTRGIEMSLTGRDKASGPDAVKLLPSA